MALRRTRKRMESEVSDIPMTPMIDVVFQLLIYFLVTIQPEDIISHLDVFRPSPESKREEMDTPPKMIRITIFTDGYTINDRPVDLANLDKLLYKLASFDRNQTILIMCTATSPHGRLVRVLDLCAKSKLNNLSVVSMN